jgi:Leucine-rich repeat (LRR) protein
MAVYTAEKPEAALETAGAARRSATPYGAVVLAIPSYSGTDTRIRDLWRRSREFGVTLMLAIEAGESAGNEIPRWSRRVPVYHVAKDFNELLHAVQSPVHLAPIPFMAPPVRAGFLGRTREIEEIKGLLGVSPVGAAAPIGIAEQTRTVVIVGLGGIGKTALARAVCHDDDVIDRFDDGIAWMTLGSDPDLLNAATAVLAAFGEDVAGSMHIEEAERRIAAHVSNKRCLVVVDDVFDAAHLKLISSIGPQARAIVTTRTHHITAATAAATFALPPLSTAEARTWMERQGLSPDIAAQLAQKLGNLPLALELAEQTLRRGVLAEDLIERIGDEGLTAIDTGISRDASASLFASLMFALEGLPQEDRLRLPMLAVLPPSRPVDLATFAENSGIGLLEGEAMARRVAAMSLIAFDDVNQTVSISPPVHAFLRSLQLRQDRAEANRRSSSGKVEGIIGISYRRDDAAAHAGRLYDRLSQRFGFDCVFLDVDAILPGENFVQATRRRMDGATAWLVVMGPNWARSVSSRGERRLDDPDDFVRIEVATALERDIPVIPVLVAGATMPRSEELPPDLQGLVHRQAIALDDSGFHQGVDQLIYALERSGTSSRPARLPAKIQEFQDGSAAEGRAEALRRIAACRTAQAEELDLGGLQLTVLDGELLAALCGLGWLRKLFLGPSVEDRGKLQLALANRERSSKLGNALVALPGALFDALKQLDRLDLAHNWLRGLPASTANLTALTSLDLTGNRIGDEGAQALKGLVNLTRLDMAGNEIGAAGATALKGLVNLTRLNLAGNEIGDEGAPALEGLVNLTSLNLAGNEIGDKGVQALKGLVNLTSLDLSYNNIGAEGAQALKGLVNLTSLDLAGNEVGDISPLVLLRNLRKINLSGSHLDHDVPAFWMLPSLQEVILHGARLPGVPVEILSRDGSFDNCLDRLRAHLADLTGDDVPVSDVKLMMLGNGRVGKTQICRRLRGESFDEAVPSTHGIPDQLTAARAASIRCAGDAEDMGFRWAGHLPWYACAVPELPRDFPDRVDA